MFVDEARIFVKAGKGGNGCESFYRDRYARHPKPDGGDGGKGGDIIFVASPAIQTLLDYRYRQHYKAAGGGHASSQGKTGKNGEDAVLRVPVGTILRDADTGLLIRDLNVAGTSVCVARGGQGGWGNARHKKPVPPQNGEERTIHLELKILADVGFVGFPNAGKSTLISHISNVKSRIAAFPFTTKQPILGVVQTGDRDFVVADLPGLIEGAHTGRGLGDRFLKHAERTKLLVQLVDMGATEGRDPLADYENIVNELQRYGHKLGHKPRLVVGNKVDLPEAREHYERFVSRFPGQEMLLVSAQTGEGVAELVRRMQHALAEVHSG